MGLFYDLAAQFASFGGTTADTNTIAWLEGAAGVNRGDTAAADFIRGYTVAQISIRSGQQITDTQLQAASDGIASDVFDDIANNGFVLPSFNRVGTHDVEGTIEGLASFDLPTDVAIWSGNLLFPGLGDASFFRENLIEDSSDTYDLVTAVASIRQVGPITSIASAAESFWTLFSNSNQISAVASETVDFLTSAYGFNGVQLGGFIATANLEVGQQSSSDTLVGSEGADFLHGGGGNDHFVGGIAEDVISGLRIDIIDGGSGFDTVSYQEITNQYDITGINVLLGAGPDSNVPLSAIITYEDGDTSQNYLYDVEAITLGDGDDWVRVSSLTNLQFIDAGNHTDGQGDGIDVSTSTSGANIDLANHTISIDGQDMSIVDFENVVGSSSADQITGDGEDNIIDGGAGNDVIDGGSSGSEEDSNHDTISGGEGDDVIHGGAGTDSLMGGSGNDTITDSEDGATMFGGTGDDSLTVEGDEGIIYGGSGNDTLDASQATGSIVLSGGSGDDTLHGNGQSVLQGGSGADEFHIQTGDIILDAEAQDTLYLNGELISSVDGRNVVFGMEVGPFGNSAFVDNFTFTEDASTAFVLEINDEALGDNFDGTFQTVSYTLYIYTDFVRNPDPDNHVFDLSQADYVIADFNLGDFGILPNGTSFGPGFPRGEEGDTRGIIHNTNDVAGHFIHNGIDYHLGLDVPFTHGPGATLSEEELADEAAFEELTEGAEDDPLFPENDSTAPPPTGTNGDDRFGSPVLSASVSVAATGDEMYDGADGDDIIQGNDGSDTLIGGAGNDTIIGGTYAFAQLTPEEPVVGEPVGLAAIDANGDGLIDVQEAGVLEPWLPGIELLFEEFDTTEDGHWNEQEFGVVVDLFGLPYPYDPDGGGGGEVPPPEGIVAVSSVEAPADLGDDLSGGEGNDLIYGGEGNDTITGDEGDDRLFGEADSDILSGGDGHDRINGGEGDDLVTGDEGNDTITGGTGNDTLSGNAGGDDVEGGDGDDSITGELGNDTLNGKDGDDTLEGNAGDDSLIGAEGDDRLEGHEGTDTVSGGMGADTIIGGSGDDALNGGEGNDVYEYSAGDGSDTILELNGGGSDRLAFTDIASTEVSLSRVNGDLLITMPDGSVLTLDRQYTSISGRIEYLEFSDGVTTTISDLDLDIIIQGTSGDDLLDGSQFQDEIIQGLAGNDTLASDGGDDSLYGGDGNDILSSTGDWELLDGGNGDDTLIGSQGWDTYIGGDGVDTLDLSYSALNFDIDLGAGTLQFPNSSQDPPSESVTGIENVIGGSGNNTIVGSSEANTLDGGTGSDTLTGAGGNDLFLFNSGDGSDTVTDFEIGSDQIEVDGVILNPTNVPTSVSITQQGQNIEIAYGSGDVITLENTSLTDWIASFGPIVSGTSGDDTVTGTSNSELIIAGTGNDTVYVGAGDDTISYHSGDDVIIGKKKNAGEDTLDLSQYNADEVTFRVDGHDVFIETPDGTIELHYQNRYEIGHVRTNIETIVFADGTLDEEAIRNRSTNDLATTGDDTIDGSYLDDTIEGSAGNDTVDAWYGNDLISYVSGNDMINGSYGQDTLDLSQYNADEVTFRVEGHDVFIDTPDGTIELHYQVRYEVGNTRTNIETLVFADTTLDDAAIRDRAMADQATTGDDSISGTYNNDTIPGSAGNDTIDAGYGDDLISYVSGDDQIIGGQGQDTLDLSQYASNDVSFRIDGFDVLIDTPDGTIELHYQVRFEVGHSASNIESITFSDGSLDDAAIRDRAVNDAATAGDDQLLGTIHADTLVGTTGNDTLTGDEGADVFVFTLGDGMDTVADFVDGEDVIQLAGGHAGFADLSITEVNGDTVINYGGDNTVTLTGISSSLLSEDDFLFT